MLSNQKRHKLGFIIGLLSTAFIQSACSSVPEAERTDRRDPYEGVNRGAFAFNMGLDTHVLEPTASAYKNTIPKTGQRAIENHHEICGRVFFQTRPLNVHIPPTVGSAVSIR